MLKTFVTVGTIAGRAGHYVTGVEEMSSLSEEDVNFIRTVLRVVVVF